MKVPNFARSVFCLFGLPFDDVGLADALSIVRKAARERTRCFITTPNLHFVTTSLYDAEFRNSVLRSDLSLVDGMPLVWAARLFGIALKGRVTGAGLFDAMRHARDASPPLKVYIFGGAKGIAAQASDKLNAEGGGVRCVGYRDPGFGSVEEISSPSIIDHVNASGADFILVALGAKKGQAWIQHNIGALTPPIVSHLGAVINFTAGTVRRAPIWVQEAGLEWAWRIYQEPNLWRRYGKDAVVAFGLFAAAAWRMAAVRLAARRTRIDPPALDIRHAERRLVIGLRGTWTSAALEPLRDALLRHAETDMALTVDATRTAAVDSTVIALLLILRRYRLDRGLEFRVEGMSSSLARIFKAHGAGELAGDRVAGRPHRTVIPGAARRLSGI